MAKILVVDDEATYRKTLAFNLRRDSSVVEEAGDGAMALSLWESFHPDLILLDLMLPKVSGVEVTKQIRKRSRVPIIMLTAKDAEVDKIVGLEIGADDYVTKPFSYRELVARISALLRRSHFESQDESDTDHTLRVGNIVVDTAKHEVIVNGDPVSMPLREFELLELFMRNPDIALTRTQIFDRIWGIDYIGDTKTLDVHVKRLRNKIEKDPSRPQCLVTVRGVGYRLVAHP
ncbi:MAG: response regulator transcription factor [Arcanobacterium sp.]|nr:response regulator transcription factor [Arcanobacterium sp.]